jgi:hypothetical protein
MPRAPGSFKQADVKRAVAGVSSAGITVTRVEIDREGRIVIFAAHPGGFGGGMSGAGGGGGTPQSALDAWRARNASSP